METGGMDRSALAGVRVLRTLPEAGVQRLLRASTPLEPRSGASIFVQGDRADALYAVTGGEGHVRIGAGDRRSKSLMFEVFRAGEIFGELGVLEGSTRTADAVTEGRVRLLRISGAAFMSVLAEFPELGLALCQVLSERLRRTSILLQDATFETLEVRLARQILYLAGLDGRRTDQGLRLGGRFRQSDLADLLGATTRSIITILNAWRAAGLVNFDATAAQLTILRENELRSLVEGEAR
jgi:CRP/FNR family transcriptional regulator, cyclic AMP receptor protein